jgi:hypothetical protein
MANYPQTTTTQFTNDIVLTVGGNAGIGTTSPGALLHAVGTTTAAIITDVNDGIRGLALKTAGNYEWSLYVKGSDLRFIEEGTSTDAITLQHTTRYVGIGTTNPGCILDINVPNSGTPKLLAFSNSGGGFSDIAEFDYDATNTPYPLTLSLKHSRPFVVSGGSVGIGATSPSTTLDVNGNGRFRSVGSGTYNAPLNLTSDGTLTTSTSDKRKKKNIAKINGALSGIAKLRGVRFQWKDSMAKGKQIGMIAQEVEKVYPELVFTNPIDGYKGIRYAEMTAVLVEALKEQQKRIDALEEKLSLKKESKPRSK